MAQLAKHGSSLLGDQKVVSSNPGDTRGLLGSHMNELVQYPNKTVYNLGIVDFCLFLELLYY